MEPLQYESVCIPSALEITVSPGETVIRVPPPSAFRYALGVMRAMVGLLATGAGVHYIVTEMATKGFQWHLVPQGAFVLGGMVLFALLLVWAIRDRYPVHEFRVTADLLSVVRTSGHRRIVGDWRRDDLAAVVAHLGPRLASGRRQTYLDIRLADTRTTELLHGHDIGELRRIAQAINDRLRLVSC
jgi:hypothetical protein